MIKRRKSKEKVRIRIYSRNSPVNNISHIRSSKYIPKRKILKWIKMKNCLQSKTSDIKTSWTHNRKLMLQSKKYKLFLLEGVWQN